MKNNRIPWKFFPWLIGIIMFIIIVIRGVYPTFFVRKSGKHTFYLGKVYTKTSGPYRGSSYNLQYKDKGDLKVTDWEFSAAGEVGDEVSVGYHVIMKLYESAWGDVYDVYYVDIKCFDISELKQPDGGWQENPLDSLKEQGLLDCDYSMQKN